MINLRESNILDILPSNLNQSTDVQSLSYALSKAIVKLLNFANRIEVYSNVKDLPESILDHLAMELRAQYYDENLQIDKKREIIKNSMIWYRYAGTSSAIEELAAIIFGSGQVKEWYSYNGEPHHFKIATKSFNISDNVLDELNSIIEQVKRKSSVLDGIIVNLETTQSNYYGIAMHSADFITLEQEE